MVSRFVSATNVCEVCVFIRESCGRGEGRFHLQTLHFCVTLWGGLGMGNVNDLMSPGEPDLQGPFGIIAILELVP